MVGAALTMSRQTPFILLGLSLVALTLVIQELKRSENTAPPSSAEHEVPEAPPAIATSTPAAPEPIAAPSDSPRALDMNGLPDFTRMADGSPIPLLPADTPKKIRLGVALFRYAGAQGASPTDRSRTEAHALAEEALKSATEGFRRAIAKGDPGSNEDIGWVQRNVLERRVEAEVFRLQPGEIAAAPVETPRGFWVVRRIK